MGPPWSWRQGQGGDSEQGRHAAAAVLRWRGRGPSAEEPAGWGRGGAGTLVEATLQHFCDPWWHVQHSEAHLRPVLAAHADAASVVRAAAAREQPGTESAVERSGGAPPAEERPPLAHTLLPAAVRRKGWW